MLNPYETLGVSQTATTEEIEAGYQNMLALHHDELVADPKGALWSSLESSRSLLSNPTSRATQDSVIALLANQPPKNPAKESPVQKTPVYEAPVQKVPSKLVSDARDILRPQSVPAQQSSFQTVENVAPALPSAQPIHPVKQVTQSAPKVSNVPQDASEEGNLLRNVKKPVINWQEMTWFNRDYSGLRENIKTPHPGLKKGFFGTVAFFTSIFLLAVYADTYDLSWAKGWPVNVVFATVAGIAWIKHCKNPWSGNKKYLALMGVSTAFLVYSILFGKHEGSSVVMAVVLGIISLGTAYLGLGAATNLSRWITIATARQLIRQNLSTKKINNTMSWGQAGNLDNAVDKFGAQEIALGSAGEKFTAEFMQELLKIPGTRIFHGLKFPGSDNADVDHAIINGDKIVFVDSKMWKAGHYRWQWDGVIERKDEKGETPINSNFHTAVIGYSRKLPEAQIRSKILIYSGSGRPVTVDNSNAEKPHSPSAPVTELTDAQEFYREVGDWFSEGKPGYINKKLISALYSNLKAS